MIVQNKGAAIVFMNMSFVAQGPLKDYIKGDLEFDLFWEGFDKKAALIIDTAFNPNTTYPKTLEFKGIKIRIDEPYTINAVVGMHHGGVTVDHSITVINAKKQKSSLVSQQLINGVIIESPLCIIVSALLKRAFAKERQRRSYDSWTMAAKLRSQQMIESIDQELENFKRHPAITFVFPENIIVAQDGNIFIANIAEVPWLNGVDRVTNEEISIPNVDFVNDFLKKAIDLYKGIYGAPGSVDELAAELSSFGVAVQIPTKWLMLHDKSHLIGEMTMEFRRFLESYPEQILSTFAYYVKHTYGGMDLTGSELASTMYDFTRVINKFTNRSVRFRVENQFSNIYELIAVIMKDQDKPMSLLDISDFIIYHNLRIGAISFQLTDNAPTDITVEDFNKIKELSKNLTMPAKDSINFQENLSKNANGNLQLDHNGKIFEFEVTVGAHVVNKAEVVDCILSQRTLGYEAVEMLECIEGLYLACLDTSIVPGDLYNLNEGKFKFTIPSIYLNTQIHPGLTTPNFNIYTPGNN